MQVLVYNYYVLKALLTFKISRSFSMQRQPIRLVNILQEEAEALKYDP